MGRVAARQEMHSRRGARRARSVVLPALVAACLGGSACGCLNLRAIPLDIPPQDPPVECASPGPSPRTDGNLSGALDGPTLRLALRDLAVILDTLGRLEQVRPDLKPQMLRELADADAATAAAVVKRWRGKLPELQAAAEHARIASTDTRASDRAPGDAHPQALVRQAAPSSSKEQQDTTDSAAIAPATAETTQTDRGLAPQPLPVSLMLDSIPDEDPPGLPSWDDLLESLLGMTRDRVEELGPDAARARIQLALLELVRHSQECGSDAAIPDSQLWSHLNPAIEYCFGTGNAGQASAQEVVRSLQVATELLRGPGRFQLRGLAFCSRIRGFGNIDHVESAAFGAGQTVLLYSEVEHFFSEPGPGGFRTRISSIIELLDANGCVVWSQDFGSVEDTSNGPRRDYFLSYRFRLPQQVKPGVYAVRLTLCDELANRSASGAIALSIR